MSEPSWRLKALLGIRKKKPQKPLLPIATIMRWTQWTYWYTRGKGFCYNTAYLRPKSGAVEQQWAQQHRFKPWAAWKVRINKRNGTFSGIGQPVFFARRKKAADKAYQWYEKAQRRADAIKLKKSTLQALYPTLFPKKGEATASNPSWRNEKREKNCESSSP